MVVETLLRDQTINVRLSVEEKRQLIELARREDRKPGQLCRRLIFERLTATEAKEARGATDDRT